jgi:hypothetical protein
MVQRNVGRSERHATSKTSFSMVTEPGGEQEHELLTCPELAWVESACTTSSRRLLWDVSHVAAWR